MLNGGEACEKPELACILKELVGERGFEPPTPWSRTRCSTRLSHSPNAERNRRGLLGGYGRSLIIALNRGIADIARDRRQRRHRERSIQQSARNANRAISRVILQIQRLSS